MQTEVADPQYTPYFAITGHQAKFNMSPSLLNLMHKVWITLVKFWHKTYQVKTPVSWVKGMCYQVQVASYCRYVKWQNMDMCWACLYNGLKPQDAGSIAERKKVNKIATKPSNASVASLSTSTGSLERILKCVHPTGWHNTSSQLVVSCELQYVILSIYWSLWQDQTR